MLDLGVKLAFPESRVLGYVEREAFAASVLLDRMETAHLEPAPIFCGNLQDVDARPLRGHVDLVTAGLPCQPYSAAGARKGDDDERAIWPEFVRIVRECEPAAVFIENVPGFLKLAEPLWSELRGLGFEWAPPYLATASEFGSIQERARVFLWATHRDRRCTGHTSQWTSGAASERRGQGRPKPEGLVGRPDADECGRVSPRPDHKRRERTEDDSTAGRPGGCTRLEERHSPPPSADSVRRDAHERTSPARREQSDDSWRDRTPPRPHGLGLPRDWSGWLFDVERQTLRHDVDGCGPRCGICGTPWEAESPPVRVDHGYPGRVDELRAIGNGVVPVVVARAIRELWSMTR